MGLYVLAAGEPDRQQPHTEDEVYYVISGRGRVTVGDEVRDVGPGSIVFVATGVPHRFHDITEDLTLFVVFGPAEGSRAALTRRRPGTPARRPRSREGRQLQRVDRRPVPTSSWRK